VGGGDQLVEPNIRMNSEKKGEQHASPPSHGTIYTTGKYDANIEIGHNGVVTKCLQSNLGGNLSQP